MKNKLLVAALMVVFSHPAFAFKWGQKTKIVGVYAYSNGPAYVTTENNENPDACANSKYLAVDPASAHFNHLYSTALTAYMTGTTVSINYDGCLGEYPRIISIAIPNIW